MRARIAGLLRRVATSRRLAPALALFAVPVAASAGARVVVGDYYGMLVGQQFGGDEEAARHYFRTGWRLGVIPTPFVDLPEVRFSALASLLMRNQLARVARGASPRGRWAGTPSRVLRAVDLTASAGGRSGWLAGITAYARRAPHALTLLVGIDEVRWDEYVSGCRELTAAARRVAEQGLIEPQFYIDQVGGHRPLSPQAALDDYVSNGEVDGRMPNPFFEPEWYAAMDPSQLRRGRPVNQLLDYVGRGERGQAGPHFWGHRYLEQLGGAEPGEGRLAHFLHRAPADASTPSSPDVAPVSRRDAERLARASVGAYHHALAVLEARGPVLSRHRRAAPAPAVPATGTCLVIVDERHLTTPSAVASLGRAAAQTLRGLRVAVVEAENAVRLAALDELFAEIQAVDAVERRPGESLGAVIGRLLDDVDPDAWTVWTPGQAWRPAFLERAVHALEASADVAAAAVVTGALSQPWLRTDDATWLDGIGGEGVVLRGRGRDGVRPDETLDFGVVAELMIRLAASHRAVVIEEPLVDAEQADEVTAHERRAGRNAARARHLEALRNPLTPGVGIAMPTFQDWWMTLTAVRRVLATVGDAPVTVAVVDNGSRRPVASILASAFAADERVVVRRMPRNTDFALGSNIGAGVAARERTVFLNNDTAVQDGWLDPLMAALDEGAAAVQPLLLYGDRTVQTAGTVFLGGMSMPQHLLAGAHAIDVGAQVDAYDFSALSAACMAVRTEDFLAVGGFDPRFVNGMEDVDLSLRLRARTGRPLRVRTSSKVVHYESRTEGRFDHHIVNRELFALTWRAALVHELDDRAIFDEGPVRLVDVGRTRYPESPLWLPRAVLASRRERPAVDEPAPRLRWAIKTSATADVAGDVWGDTFFAESLADALRRAGQDVVIDRVASHSRDSGSWDDVTLTLRGLTGFLPQPDAINLMWVISHPDLVTRHELESGFDRVYAAGRQWADRIRDEWGVDVRTLLQATDAARFSGVADAARAGAARSGVLFVGRTRGVHRPIVTDVIAAGAEPEVYGDDGWDQYIDPRFVKGFGVANEELPRLYSAARFVLNDHWADMAEQGFFSNRLFDAAAAGARIISDAVPGMADVFGAQVQTYRDVAHLAELLDPGSDVWPSDDELARRAESVAEHHSFDARARTLIADAIEIRRGRG